MRLFDDLERFDRSPAAHGEDGFSFLNRADGIGWARIRDVLERWFADYPPAHAGDLRGKFRSKRAGAHFGAWWELYLHRLLQRLGYEVEVHPEMPGTSSRPDFELRREQERIYLEAAVVFSGIVDEQRDGIREGWIMDAVNRGKNPSFHLQIEFQRLGTNRPKDRDIYRPLEEWLAGLNPDHVIAEHGATGSLPEETVEVDDWRVRFEAIPVRPEARGGEPGRLLGYGPVSAGFVDDKEQLRHTLKHKRGRYGTPDAPLMVAVNCASSFPKDEDVAGALYGSIGYQYREGEPGHAKSVRLRDGTWMGEPGARGQRMSGVLSAVQLHPWTAVQVEPRLWLNPWATKPLSVDWPFTTWRCTESGLVEAEPRAVDMADLLGLPADWPGPEDPFRVGPGADARG